MPNKNTAAISQGEELQKNQDFTNEEIKQAITNVTNALTYEALEIELTKQIRTDIWKLRNLYVTTSYLEVVKPSKLLFTVKEYYNIRNFNTDTINSNAFAQKVKRFSHKNNLPIKLTKCGNTYSMAALDNTFNKFNLTITL
jgi:hypothetical protein